VTSADLRGQPAAVLSGYDPGKPSEQPTWQTTPMGGDFRKQQQGRPSFLPAGGMIRRPLGAGRRCSLRVSSRSDLDIFGERQRLWLPLPLGKKQKAGWLSRRISPQRYVDGGIRRPPRKPTGWERTWWSMATRPVLLGYRCPLQKKAQRDPLCR